MAEDEVKEPAPIEPVDESKVAEMNAASARLEKATSDANAAVERQKAAETEATLAGKADAQVTKKEETNEEYAKKVMANDVETK